MEADYCVPCQASHKMIASCLKDIQCKMCDKKGHLRIDCPGQDLQDKEEVPNPTGSKKEKKPSQD